MNDQFRFGTDILHEVLDALGLSGAKSATQRLILDFGKDRFPHVYLDFAPDAAALERLKAIEGLNIAEGTGADIRALFETGTVGHEWQREFILSVLRDVLRKADTFPELEVAVQAEREMLKEKEN